MSAMYHVYHPEQARAKWTVHNRVRRGKLVKPDICERCSKRFALKFIEAHHWSYLKVHHADVIWLCRWCHKIVHAELGPKWKGEDPVRPDLRLKKPLPVAEDRPLSEMLAQEQKVNPMGLY